MYSYYIRGDRSPLRVRISHVHTYEHTNMTKGNHLIIYSRQLETSGFLQQLIIIIIICAMAETSSYIETRAILTYLTVVYQHCSAKSKGSICLLVQWAHTAFCLCTAVQWSKPPIQYLQLTWLNPSDLIDTRSTEPFHIYNASLLFFSICKLEIIMKLISVSFDYRYWYIRHLWVYGQYKYYTLKARGSI